MRLQNQSDPHVHRYIDNRARQRKQADDAYSKNPLPQGNLLRGIDIWSGEKKYFLAISNKGCNLLNTYFIVVLLSILFNKLPRSQGVLDLCKDGFNPDPDQGYDTQDSQNSDEDEDQ